MEGVTCKICGSKKYKICLSNLENGEFDETFRLVKCGKCGFVYLSPRPDKKIIAKYYPQATYWSKKLDAAHVYSHLYKFIFSEIKNGSVLDIGAGTGLFLSYFKQLGWVTEGIEISPTAAKFAKNKLKINLKVGDLLDFEIKNKQFDLITLNNVLEHLYNPNKTLCKINKILKDDGYVFISVPNIKSFGAHFFKGKWYGIDAPRHLYQFSLDTLTKLLKKNGFNIVKTTNNFWRHNYDIIFESFRLLLSPKSNRNQKALLGSIPPESLNGIKSLAKKIIVFLFKIISAIIAVIEPIFGGGEIITILVKKT